MKILGNILWFIFGGAVASLVWLILGLLMCVTIIGIPFGLQAFKFAKLMLLPFGKEVETQFDKHPIMNIIWAFSFGSGMALNYLVIAFFTAITIIGIPFAKQWMKLARLSLIPFGATIS